MGDSEVIAKNISDSASDFLNIVWPALKDVPGMGGGSIIPMETEKDVALALDLDRLSGVDAWQVLDGDRGIRTIASRINWRQDRRNFTIRFRNKQGKESEYFKRLYAIENPDLGLTIPHLTVQGFVSKRGGELMSAAAIPTKDLILHIKQLFDRGIINDDQDDGFGIRRGGDGVSFVFISWDYILESDIADSIIIAEVPRASDIAETGVTEVPRASDLTKADLIVDDIERMKAAGLGEYVDKAPKGLY